MTRPRGFCSSCKNLHLVRDDGTIGRHTHMPTRSSDQLYCAGTGKPPIQDDRSEGTVMITPYAQPPESHDNAGGPGALPATSADRPVESHPTARFGPNPFRAGFERLAAEMDKVRTEARQRHAATIARMNRDRP